jgi:hypothetical protein
MSKIVFFDYKGTFFKCGVKQGIEKELVVRNIYFLNGCRRNT